MATAATGRAGNGSASDEPGGDPTQTDPTLTHSDSAAAKASNGAPARGGRLPRSARRKQLLAAAQEVFVAQGYHAAAMDDIAERAGVSKPVLYQHFPGKLELYLALLDTHADDAGRRGARRRWRRPTDNKQRVHSAVSAYFDFVDDEGRRAGRFRLVFESDLRNEPAVRERVERVGAAVHAGDHRHDRRRHRADRRPQAELLAGRAWPARPRSAPAGGWPASRHVAEGRGGAAARRPGLARHRQLPAAGRRRGPADRFRSARGSAVRTRRHHVTPRIGDAPTTGGPRWRSRSACSTRPRARAGEHAVPRRGREGGGRRAEGGDAACSLWSTRRAAGSSSRPTCRLRRDRRGRPPRSASRRLGAAAADRTGLSSEPSVAQSPGRLSGSARCAVASARCARR